MKDARLHELLSLANHYPSPHNGQPIRVRPTSDTDFDLCFQRERGLQAVDISFIFSFVSMGVFVQHLTYACQALGHQLTYELSLPTETDLRGDGVVKFAAAHIEWDKNPPDNHLKETLLFRQTSRRKYTEPPKPELVKKLPTLAGEHMTLKGLDKEQTHQAIWLNQRAVFDDMFDDAVRHELNHWLRYSHEEKIEKHDGLAYDAMMINGRAMKFSVDHYQILHAPIIASLLKTYYLRTMKDNSQVFYMTAPFATPRDSFNVGLTVMTVWQEVSAARQYLHPFGTIMSNHAAHRDFVTMAGITHESREKNYLVFIFRLGGSKQPVVAERLPYKTHLLMEET
jgi:hypothetical protein